MESKSDTSQLLHSYLSFILEEEVFAVNVQKVLEVLEYQKITKVPRTPDYMLGVINFRGEILPVIDSRQKFAMEKAQVDARTVIIVLDLTLNGNSITIGALADSVKDVLEIRDDDIKPVPELGNKYDTQFLKGMIKSEDGFIMILDAERIFSTEELIMVRGFSRAVEGQSDAEQDTARQTESQEIGE